MKSKLRLFVLLGAASLLAACAWTRSEVPRTSAGVASRRSPSKARERPETGSGCAAQPAAIAYVATLD